MNINKLTNIIESYNQPSDDVQIISSKDWYQIINFIETIKNKHYAKL